MHCPACVARACVACLIVCVVFGVCVCVGVVVVVSVVLRIVWLCLCCWRWLVAGGSEPLVVVGVGWCVGWIRLAIGWFRLVSNGVNLVSAGCTLLCWLALV